MPRKQVAKKSDLKPESQIKNPAINRAFLFSLLIL